MLVAVAACVSFCFSVINTRLGGSSVVMAEY